MTTTDTDIKKTFKAKSKGNLYENKIAKELGTWIFGDKYMLGRHITSGAQKHTYVGDIVPHKRIPEWFNGGEWNFLIECKNGYKNNIPNLNNQNIIRQWIKKSIQERTGTQSIIYLIVSFHGYSPLLITDIPFNLTADLIINHKEKGETIQFHLYRFKELIEYNFSSLYENNELLLKRLSN